MEYYNRALTILLAIHKYLIITYLINSLPSVLEVLYFLIFTLDLELKDHCFLIHTTYLLVDWLTYFSRSLPNSLLEPSWNLKPLKCCAERNCHPNFDRVSSANDVHRTHTQMLYQKLTHNSWISDQLICCDCSLRSENHRRLKLGNRNRKYYAILQGFCLSWLVEIMFWHFSVLELSPQANL